MRNGAFSLVETNLAILLVGVGLLALFSLFPLGLQQSDLAMQDSQEATFGDFILSTIEGNAFSVTDWDVWQNMPTLSSLLVEGITNVSFRPIGSSFVASNNAFNFPRESPRYVSYVLTLSKKPGTGGKLGRATVRAVGGRNQDTSLGRVYYTEFMFMGE